ncbi:hypothetical protein ACS0TY_033373 [Phlomoides rotata]
MNFQSSSVKIRDLGEKKSLEDLCGIVGCVFCTTKSHEIHSKMKSIKICVFFNTTRLFLIPLKSQLNTMRFHFTL